MQPGPGDSLYPSDAVSGAVQRASRLRGTLEVPDLRASLCTFFSALLPASSLLVSVPFCTIFYPGFCHSHLLSVPQVFALRVLVVFPKAPVGTAFLLLIPDLSSICFQPHPAMPASAAQCPGTCLFPIAHSVYRRTFALPSCSAPWKAVFLLPNSVPLLRSPNC